MTVECLSSSEDKHQELLQMYPICYHCTDYHIRIVNTLIQNILYRPIGNIAHAITARSSHLLHMMVENRPSWWMSSERWPLGRVSIRIQNHNSHVSTIDRSTTNYRLDHIWLSVHLKSIEFRDVNTWNRPLCLAIESLLRQVTSKSRAISRRTTKFYACLDNYWA